MPRRLWLVFVEALVILGLTIAALVLGRVPYLGSPGLIADDLIIVPSIFAGGYAYAPPSLPVLWWLLDRLIALSGSVETARIVAISMAGLAALAWYGALRLFHAPRALSAVAVMLALLHPFMIDQYVFVSGSHPSFALFFFSFGFLAASLAVRTARTAWCFLFAAAGMLFFIAATLTSTLFSLAPCGLLPLAVFYALRRDVGRALVIVMLALGPSLLLFVRQAIDPGTASHYVELGWVDYDPATLLPRAVRVLTRFFRDGLIGTVTWGGVVALVVAAGVLLALQRWGRRPAAFLFDSANVGVKSPPAWLAGLCLVCCAALTFGPSLTVLNYAERYYAPPIAFGVLGVALLLASSALRRRSLGAIFVAIALGLGVAWIQGGRLAAAKEFGPLFAEEERVIAALKQEAPKIALEGQLIVLLDAMPAGFTSGYIHWSSWFVRYATGRRDLTAVVGLPTWLAADLFVPTPADGAEHWDYGGPNDPLWTTDPATGLRQRIRMTGFLRDRPLYAYGLSSKASALQELPELVLRTGLSETIYDLPRDRLLRAGQTRDLVSGCPHAPENAVVVTMPSNGSGAESFGLPSSVGETFAADGQSVHRYDVAPGFHSVKLSMVLYPEADAADAKPPASGYPMPLLWGPIRIDEVRDRVLAVAVAGRTIATVDASDNRGVSFAVAAERDCRLVVSVNGRTAVFDSTAGLDKGIQIGKGYAERYWRGRIEDIRFEVNAPSSP